MISVLLVSVPVKRFRFSAVNLSIVLKEIYNSCPPLSEVGEEYSNVLNPLKLFCLMVSIKALYIYLLSLII